MRARPDVAVTLGPAPRLLVRRCDSPLERFRAIIGNGWQTTLHSIGTDRFRVVAYSSGPHAYLAFAEGGPALHRSGWRPAVDSVRTNRTQARSRTASHPTPTRSSCSAPNTARSQPTRAGTPRSSPATEHCYATPDQKPGWTRPHSPTSLSPTAEQRSPGLTGSPHRLSIRTASPRYGTSHPIDRQMACRSGAVDGDQPRDHRPNRGSGHQRSSPSSSHTAPAAW